MEQLDAYDSPDTPKTLQLLGWFDTEIVNCLYRSNLLIIIPVKLKKCVNPS